MRKLTALFLFTLLAAGLLGCARRDPEPSYRPSEASRVARAERVPSEARAAERPGDAPPPLPEPPRAARVDAAPQKIRVGAWNIEWLGTPNSRSGIAKGIHQSAEDLADYILAADLAILGVEEIAQEGDTEPWTNNTLTRAFEIIRSRTGQTWTHRLYPAHSGRNQLCGLAWDTRRITALGEPEAVKLPEDRTSGQAWSRPPWGQEFSAGEGLTDFIVIVIHMKSDYGGSFDAQRRREADLLARSLPQTFSDADVLIIGDANCGEHAEPAVTCFEEAGFVDLNAGDEATHIRYGPLDRAFVPANQPEFHRQSFEVHRRGFCDARGLTDDDFKRRFSDHFMVVTEIDVMRDDD